MPLPLHPTAEAGTIERHEVQCIEGGDRVIVSREVDVALFETSELAVTWKGDNDE